MSPDTQETDINEINGDSIESEDLLQLKSKSNSNAPPGLSDPDNKPIKKKRTPKDEEQLGSEITGQSSLPLSRIKKLIKLDDEVRACASSAAFAVTIATEMFIQYLCDQSLHMSRSEKRKTLHYKDIANAVNKIDELMFLSDIVPKPVPLGKVLLDRKIRAETGEIEIDQKDLTEMHGPGSKVKSQKLLTIASLPNGQSTLKLTRPNNNTHDLSAPPHAVAARIIDVMAESQLDQREKDELGSNSDADLMEHKSVQESDLDATQPMDLEE
ncbi:uncharacterized protein V1516DRAFT_656830 [Lipomyces oligophaga]|uniref:uncharacterized protein n=1 Tax=Lipomyces oligophaga TaxID=45792 RepID=UPI0034CE5774